MKRKLTMFLALFFLGIGIVQAQTQVRGTVVDEAGEPVIGATVQVKGTTQGTITDTNGNFTLSASAGGTLVVSYVGKITQEIPVTASPRIVLFEDSEILEEVMVVAYGTARKESFTGSASVVKSTDLIKRNASSVTKAIEGTVSGIQVTSGGGQPGSGAEIRIRGIGSMNASNAPLYVVDGIPYDGYMSAINPNDIEAISILKDASASALYGARGANGVVIITTKKGKTGDVKVSLKADWGISNRSVPPYKTVGIKEYMELNYELYGAEFMSELGGEFYNPYNITSDNLMDENGRVKPDAVLRWNENWFTEAEEKNALRQDYQLSVSGGTEKAQYLMSLGYLDEEGILRGTKFDRLSAGLSLDFIPNNFMKTGLSLRSSLTKQNTSSSSGSYYTNTWYSAQLMGPIYPVFLKNSKGMDVLDENGEKIYDYGSNRPHGKNSNAIGDLKYNYRLGKNDNLSTRGYITFDTDRDIPFIRDLSFTMNIGADYYSRIYSNYANMEYGQYVDQGGNIYKENIRNLSYTFNQLLNYNKGFDLHSVDLLLGHEYYDLNYYYQTGEKKGFAFPGFYEFSAASTTTELTSRTDVYRVESYFSRLNYDFDNKYYLSFSYRTDGSSRFHKDERWGNFWSAGASYRISNEKFMKQFTCLDNLSLKISYGEQGNDNLLTRNSTFLNPQSLYYAWQGLYDLGYPVASNGGVTPVGVENKDLKWEKNRNLNSGMEATLLKNRLRFSFEYFIKNTDNLLMYNPLPVSSGYADYPANVGSMRNTGFDMTIAGTPVKTKDFIWDITFLGSVIKNKVTGLNEGRENMPPTNAYITKIGYPINSFYPVLHAGADPKTGKQLYKYYNDKDEEVITEKYDEANANRGDKNILGSRIPDFTGSINNVFNYRNIDLSWLLTFSVGGKVMDYTYLSLMSTRNAGSNMHEDLLKRWQKEGDVTDVPALSNDAKNITDFYLVDASYFSIKNITLGYTLNKGWGRKLGIESLRASVTANNVYLYTHRKGLDPQYNFSGSNDYSYAPIRNISFGLNINF